LGLSLKRAELKDSLVGADQFSPYNDRTLFDNVATITATNVEAVLFFAMADYKSLTGGFTRAMADWMEAHFARPAIPAYQDMQPGSALHTAALADGAALFARSKK
jgi:hypothetical protein